MRFPAVPETFLLRRVGIGVALAFSFLTAATHAASEFHSLDDQFAEVAARMPGFGGMYFDEHGRLNVNLKPRRDEISSAEMTAAISALEAVFGRERLAAPLGGHGHRLGVKTRADSMATRFHKVDFGFGDLYRWNDLATDVFSLEAVRTLDIDEVANRIVVGVADVKQHGDKVAQQLTAYGIPTGAVRIDERGDLVLFDHAVTDLVTPKVGGILITNTEDDGCTIGYNVQWPYLWWQLEGFVTAAHCTEVPGEQNSTRFFQPESPSDVGVEHTDPPFVSGGRCPAGRTCRRSDTAVIQYNDRSRPGVIAKPLNWLASLEIDHSSPVFSITGTAPVQMVGDVLEKVGASTGWTVSKIENTCERIRQSGDNVLLCQNITFLDEYPDIPDTLIVATFGDSGAPVFVWDLDTNASIAGTLVGSLAPEAFGRPDRRRYVYSPISNILSELGPMALPTTD